MGGKRLLAFAFLAGFVFVPAFVVGAEAQVVSENTCSFKDMLKERESQGTGDLRARNGQYIGRYQLGNSALIEAGYKNANGWIGTNGIWSDEDFMSSESAQEDAMDKYSSRNLGYLSNMTGNIGSSIPGGGCNGSPLTQAGLQMGGHLMGSGGVSEFFKSGGFCGWAGDRAPNGHVLKHATRDNKRGTKHSTCVSSYMCHGSGCEAISKDTSKDTCSVTMPMIEAISCSNMPNELRSFCNTYRPYLMTRAECSSAEEMSKTAEMGPNKEQCENLSFGPGTGSWSFVLACSWAGDFVADQDGMENTATGEMSDPECINKLKAAGVEFRAKGNYSNGSASGKTCIVENGVSVRGTAVDYGGWKEMTCDMALAMHQYDQKMAAMGVTAYEGMSSTVACRPMRNAQGDIPGTISEHGLGRAVDFSSVKVGGRSVSMGAIHQPNTPDGAIAVRAKAAACSTFRGVLSPTYAKYIGKYVHFHVEMGKLQGVCR